jgi:hypothetical protein
MTSLILSKWLAVVSSSTSQELSHLVQYCSVRDKGHGMLWQTDIWLGVLLFIWLGENELGDGVDVNAAVCERFLSGLNSFGESETWLSST